MANRKVLTIAALLVIYIAPGQSQDFAPVGTAVAQFLEIGIGARATSLGGAYTAVTNDAGSVFWNPAGLVDAPGMSLYTAYNSWPADISLGGLSFSMNLGSRGTIAISSVFLMTDDMEVTDLNSPGGTGEYFSISNTSLGLTYARYLTDRVSVGVTGKMVQEKYWDYGYSTWAIDMGTLYRTDFHGLKMGMSILHFGPDIRFSGDFIDYSDPKSFSVDSAKTFETYSLPINFRLGLSINVLENEAHRITTSADMIHPNNNLEQYNWGMEYCFNRSYFLRGGYKLIADEVVNEAVDVGGLSFGGGVRLGLMGLSVLAADYSYSNMGLLNGSHRFSLTLSL